MKQRFNYSLLAALAVVGLMLSGCALTPLGSSTIAPGYHPDNVFINDPRLSESVHRVAVLPVTCDEHRTALMDGREALESVLVSELTKTKKFEVVRISPEELRRLTGQSRWTGEEILPDGFFDKLRETYGCDAVLFGEVTNFRGYAPIAIGWRLKLVDTHGCFTIWAADEEFDAGEPAVQAGLRRFQREKQRVFEGLDGDWLALNSPRQLGQYAVAELFETLPER